MCHAVCVSVICVVPLPRWVAEWLVTHHLMHSSCFSGSRGVVVPGSSMTSTVTLPASLRARDAAVASACRCAGGRKVWDVVSWSPKRSLCARAARGSYMRLMTGHLPLRRTCLLPSVRNSLESRIGSKRLRNCRGVPASCVTLSAAVARNLWLSGRERAACLCLETARVEWAEAQTRARCVSTPVLA